MVATIAILTAMTTTVFAADDAEVTTPGDSTHSSTATGGSDGSAWEHGIDDDAIITSLDPSTDINIWATTTQIDAYKVVIEWGDMTFNYDFGTWDQDGLTWVDSGWETADFDGTKDRVVVTNHSSEPISATFDYTQSAPGGDETTGTFTEAFGNENGIATGTMNLELYPVGGPAPSEETYLNLQGIPGKIGETAAKIGTITVTIIPTIS